MLLRILVYNLLMLVVDAATIRSARQSNLAACVGGVFAAGMVAIVLAVAFGGGPFSIFHLAAYGLFLHGTIVLTGTAVVLSRRHRKTSTASAVVAIGLVAVAVDAFLVEPTWLEVTRIELPSAKIDRPIKVVVLADLQTDRIGGYERDVLRRVMEEDADVILLVGDYLQLRGEQYDEVRRQLNDLLHEIGFPGRAKVFAVEGNLDAGPWPEIFEGLDVTATRTTESFELDDLRVTCLGLWASRQTTTVVDQPTSDRYHIVLGHVPSFALGQINADLLVAGHTHGGQVRLPGIGPLMTLSAVPRSWAAGLTELPGGRKLLVSRGIGMERATAPRLRFLCRPQLVVVNLIPQSD